MKLPSLFYSALCFIVSAVLCILAAIFLAQWTEGLSKEEIRRTWAENNLGWAEIKADGLQLLIFGDAENEVERFRAISVAAKVVDAARLIDQTNVKEDLF